MKKPEKYMNNVNIKNNTKLLARNRQRKICWLIKEEIKCYKNFNLGKIKKSQWDVIKKAGWWIFLQSPNYMIEAHFKKEDRNETR